MTHGQLGSVVMVRCSVFFACPAGNVFSHAGARVGGRVSTSFSRASRIRRLRPRLSGLARAKVLDTWEVRTFWGIQTQTESTSFHLLKSMFISIVGFRRIFSLPDMFVLISFPGVLGNWKQGPAVCPNPLACLVYLLWAKRAVAAI